MIADKLIERAHELSELGSPYVIATVVRVQRPASVEPGSAGLVLADGTIEGFIGGVCAQHSVRLYSLTVLETGAPLLLRIVPDGPEDVASAPRARSRPAIPAFREVQSRCSWNRCCPRRACSSPATRRSPAR